MKFILNGNFFLNLDKGMIYRVIFSDSTNLLIIISAGQSSQTIGVETTAGGIQFHSIIFRQLGPERVDRYDQSTTISFKLKQFNPHQLCYCIAFIVKTVLAI